MTKQWVAAHQSAKEVKWFMKWLNPQIHKKTEKKENIIMTLKKECNNDIKQWVGYVRESPG